MISDLGIWTIVINLIAIAFAVQYSRSETFGHSWLYWTFWEWTGLRFVWEKVHPPPEKKPEVYRPPSTIAVWVFGLFSLYIALFGLASQRYENAVDKIENRMNAFITQIAVTSPQVRKVALVEIVEIQSLKCPVKPDILSPTTVILSFFQEDRYPETIAVLTRTVEKYKEKLNGAGLEYANLKKANLNQANLVGAYLNSANLEDAKLNGANLEKAKLFAANLEKANLYQANLMGARMKKINLKGANLGYANLTDAYLEKANLEDTDLRGANLERCKGLSIDQLCSSAALFRTKMDSRFRNEVRQKCPQLLSAQLWIEPSPKVAY